MAEPQDVQAPSTAANLPMNPDLMGYPTVEALVNAKRASDQEAQRIVAERDALKMQLANVYRAPENPRQEVRQRGTASERLTEVGIPVDVLDEYVQGKMQAAFEPIARGINARNTVLAEYPDYNKYEADVAQWIQSDPNRNQTYQRMFQSDPAAAFEWAFLKFGDSRRRAVSTDTNGLMQEAGAHAGIPTSRNGDARRTQGPGNDIQKLFEEYQRTGSKQAAERYAHARLHGIVTDEHLNA